MIQERLANLKLLINVNLASWGPVCAHVMVKNGILSIKSIELLDEQYIDLNDSEYLDYRNLSTLDIKALRLKCSIVVQQQLH